MTNLQRVVEWAQLLDEPRTECLVEIAATLLADMYGFPLPDDDAYLD